LVEGDLIEVDRALRPSNVASFVQTMDPITPLKPTDRFPTLLHLTLVLQWSHRIDPCSRSTRLPHMPVKKGSFVRAIRATLENSLEAQASDQRLPSYLFESKGEVLDIRGDYLLVKWGTVPTPNVWLRSDQLEEFTD
jgi:hypothetical protein